VSGRRSAAVSTLGRRMRRALWRAEARLASPSRRSRAPQRSAEYAVLVVCLGNYCRSPVAEGVLRSKLEEVGLGARVRIESAGTSSYYAGRRAHKYARQAALRRGIDIGGHRARGVDELDLSTYDLVVAVDERTRAELSSVAPERLVLLGSFGLGGDIADPNGRELHFFGETHDTIEKAAAGLTEFISNRLTPPSDSHS